MPELINNVISDLFYSPWGTIIGFLVGGLIGHYLAIGRDRRNAFANASREFINAMSGFLIMLETNFRHENGPIDIPIPDHLAAAKLFRGYLGRSECKCFDRILDEYKIIAAKYNDEAEQGGTINVSHETTSELKKCINSLLKYAKPK